MKRILVNRVGCRRCHTIIESSSRHEFVTCECWDGKKGVVVDGGKDYLRRCGSREDYEELSITLDDPIGLVREEFLWGTYGKSGKDELTYVKLKNISNNHLKNIMKNENLTDEIREIFDKEKEYRNAI